MTPEAAVKVAGIVAQLWPTPPLTGERLAFYASALTAIPDPDRAVRVVRDLFVTERWQPPPGAIIDRALGLDGGAMREWRKILQAAGDAQHRRAVSVALDPVAVAVLRDVCGGLVDVPLDRGSRLDKARDAFIAEYVDRLRRTAVASSERPELGTGQ